VVADLKETGRYDNTMIIFTADHGDMAGSHGYISKGAYMYDEIYRIPLVVKPAGPKVLGSRQPALVHLMDLTATIMHVLAGQPSQEMDTHKLHGASLLPLMQGSASWERPVHYAEYHGDWYGHYSSRMVTDGRWKLVWNLSDLCELYDLKNDPHELTNLFYAPEHRPLRDRYMAQLVAEAARLDDKQLALLDPAIEDQVEGIHM
jgi:arylsulfatase A-like enzyme